MSEAYPLDLNYGHLGKPVYDSERRKWQFSRQSGITRQLRPIGDPYVTLAASSGDSVEGTQSAAHRLENIKDLIRAFPELQPAGSLLPGLALTSETVNQITSNHDPAVSGLLAVGQASYLNSHRNSKAVPIFAVAGGLGGESVRLVVLRQEHLGWKGERNVYLDNFSSRSREESFWEGKGSPVQQLVFAELNGQSSDWLAVRYQGAVSILRPRLRTDNSASISQSTGGLKTRLDPNPIVTLDIERLGGIAFADVAFNPWNHQQIASIDQESHWIVWNIIGIGPKRGLWTIEKESGEYVTNIREGEEQSHAQGDGWGIVLWAGSASRLVAASRRDLAIFDIKKVVTRLDVPNLLSRNPTDWILDIKRKPSDNTCIFVATSSTLYYVNVHMSNDLKQPGAQCLLSWNHFIDPEDISLRLYVPHVPDDSHHRFASAATTILLYSRLNGMIVVFTIQSPQSSTSQAISTSDPLLLSLSNMRPALGINDLAFRAVPYGFNHTKHPSGSGQLYFESGVKFFKLVIFFYDMSLSESLYAEAIEGSDIKIDSPSSRTRKTKLMTPARVSDDFIIADGFEDDDSAEAPSEVNDERLLEPETSSRSRLSDQKARSINFEWLEKGSRRTLGESTVTATGNLNDILEGLYDMIKNQGNTDIPTMATLLRLAGRDISILDPDKATLDFKDFLEDLAQRTLAEEDVADRNVDQQLLVSKILTLPMCKLLDLKADFQVSDLYDSLLEAWIKPLSYTVPSRTRVTTERLLRNIAGQLCLTSYVARQDLAGHGEYTVPDKASATGGQFILPVRGRASAASVSKGKQPAARSQSPGASSQLSDDVGFLSSSPLRALPTPEPTPSLRSQSSISSLAGDSASQRLQGYASLAPQPALPIKLLNSILGHWQVGTDPEGYDWEAAEQAFASEDEEEMEARAEERKRAAKHLKRQRDPTVGPSSQPKPKRLGGSQPQQGQEDTQGSSQATESMAIASQVEPGRFGGRPHKKKKKKASGLRPAGFK